MPPAWLQVLSQIYVPLSVVSALVVLADIFIVGRRQQMGIMEAVWPLTMLYWGPVGLLFYFWFGRGTPAHFGHGHGCDAPMWQAVFKGATHCGAGCALGDVVGDWIAFATGAAFLGSALGARYLLAFLLAYLLGIAFQYFSLAPVRGMGWRDGTLAAIKIDTLSLLAYQVGMFACMGFRSWALPNLAPTMWSYWWMMQIAMIVGFATTYPVNWLLIRNGIKERM